MKNKSSIIVFLVGIILSWMTCWRFMFDYSYLIVFGISLVILLLLKSKLTKFFILFSPIFLFTLLGFFFGTYQYFKGEAMFQDYGFIAGQNFDSYKRFRIKETTSGCLVSGIEPMYQKPYNFAVKLCINTLGYQKGSYEGVFPEKEFCIKKLENTPLSTKAQLDLEKIIIENDLEKITLNKNNDEYWIFQTVFKKDVPSSYSKFIQAKKISEDCLIAKFNHDSIHLIDLKNNRFFHHYDLSKKE